jgi:hypothetical protein
MGCAEGRTPPRALRGKAVENGKSAMNFLVPSESDPDDAGSYTAIFKQLNDREAALLPSLFPALVEHYTRPVGSLLTPVIGWFRYAPSGGDQRPFEVLMMDNVAQAAPASQGGGGGRDSGGDGGAADVATGGGGVGDVDAWRSFDMKGIRLYKHERRYDATFGLGGLRLGAALYDALRAALHSDVDFLSRRGLVDYSYLLSAFPTGAPPRPCARVWRDADYHSVRSPPARLSPRALLAASHVLPPLTSDASGDTDDGGTDRGGRADGSGQGEAERMCTPVTVRVGIIDYLREWRVGERVEHLQKYIARDILAGERNHAVVPVLQFAERFDAFFGAALFTPVQPSSVRSIPDLACLLRHAAADMMLVLRGLMPGRVIAIMAGVADCECKGQLGLRWLFCLAEVSVHRWLRLAKGFTHLVQFSPAASRI